MKSVARAALATVLGAMILASCTQPNSQTPPPAPVDNTSAAAAPAPRILPSRIDESTRLLDANGTLLGYVTSSSAASIDLMTLKGYSVSIDWNGALLEGIALFTEPDGKGKIFFQWGRDTRCREPSRAVNGQPWVAASVDGNGFAVEDPDITSFQSYFIGGTLSNVPDTPVLAPYGAYPLKQVELADVGLPSTMALPLQIVPPKGQ